MSSLKKILGGVRRLAIPMLWSFHAVMGIHAGVHAAAGAAECRIEAGRGWVRGTADQAPLKAVMVELAQRTGCEIYLDSGIAAMPVSFSISRKTGTEKAVRSMIRPHNCAFLYSGHQGKRKARIRKLWVFAEGSTPGPNCLSVIKPPASPAPDIDIAETPPASPGEVPEDIPVPMPDFRPDVYMVKGFMGAPVVHFRHRERGPALWPSPGAMKQGWARQTRDREQYARRQETTLSRYHDAVRRRRQHALAARNEAGVSGSIQKGVKPWESIQQPR